MENRIIKDMTVGKPIGLIIKFMIPLIGANFMQQLYIFADSIIVGQGVGVEALAAIGATDWANCFVLWALSGFADGCAVLIAMRFGEKDYIAMKKSVNMAVILGFSISVIMSMAGIIAVKPLMTLLKTPENIYADAVLYMTIYYAGSFAIMLYALGAGILRALGDSTTPFKATLIASLMNIALDLIAVYILNTGVGGACAATVISQFAAGCYCFYKAMGIDILINTKVEKRIYKDVIVNLSKLGFPMAVQMSFIAIGGMILQSVINTFGFEFVAGFTATNKLNLVMEGIAMALGSAMATYMAQNRGARRLDRIEEGMKSALGIAIIVSLAIAAFLFIFGKPVLMMFISSDSVTEAKVLNIAYRYLTTMCSFIILLYLLHVYRQSIMGLGNAFIPMLSGFGEFAFRILPALLLTRTLGSSVLFFAEPSAWFGADLVLVIPYYVIVKKLKKDAKIEENLKNENN